jgi:hypothetical protein
MATGGQQFRVVITAASLLIRENQIESFRFSGARKNSRERNGQVPQSTRNLQIVYGTCRIFSRQSKKKIIFRAATRESNCRARRHYSLQRQLRDKSVQLPAFFAHRNRDLFGWAVTRPKTAEIEFCDAIRRGVRESLRRHEQDKRRRRKRHRLV